MCRLAVPPRESFPGAATRPLLRAPDWLHRSTSLVRDSADTGPPMFVQGGAFHIADINALLSCQHPNSGTQGRRALMVLMVLPGKARRMTRNFASSVESI